MPKGKARGAVVSSVSSQQEGSGFRPADLSGLSLQDFFVAVWFSSENPNTSMWALLLVDCMRELWQTRDLLPFAYIRPLKS